MNRVKAQWIYMVFSKFGSRVDYACLLERRAELAERLGLPKYADELRKRAEEIRKEVLENEPFEMGKAV